MKVVDNIDKEEIEIENGRKTVDGLWVKTNYYLKAVDELRKGALTLGEIKLALLKIKKCDSLINTALLGIKKKSAKMGISPMIELKRMMALEKKYALAELKKEPECMTREEVETFLTEFISAEEYSKLGDINKEDWEVYNPAELLNRYYSLHSILVT